MIEYTITPLEFRIDSNHLIVELIPIGVSLEPQIVIIPLSPETLANVLAMPSVEEQKAEVRKQIIACNSLVQKTWEQQQAAKDFVIPEALAALLTVPGTTPVTEAEINTL